MSILKMDKFGNIVEDTGEGFIRTAEMQPDDNVAKLSIKEDAQVVQDRLSLKKIEDANTQIAAKKAADAILIHAAQKKHALTKAENLALLNAKLSYLQNLKKSIKLAQAVLEGRNNQFREKMSGVSGHGLTADGQTPHTSMSFYDYAPIVDVHSAFGSMGFDNEPVGFEKLSSDHQNRIRSYVLTPSPVMPATVDGQSFTFDIDAILAEARQNPSASIIDIAEYDAAKTRGWGTTGYITKEGTKWTWWPYQVPFHKNVLFFKNTTANMTEVPKLMRAYAVMLQPLNNAYKLGINLNSAAEAPATSQPVVQDPVQESPVVAPVQQTQAAVEQVKEQEKKVEEAIKETEKQIEAQIQTTEAVAAISVPTTVAEAKKVLGSDYRHPMLVYNLIQKSAPATQKTVNKLFLGLGRPNYALHGKGGR